jgi:hypothetical protein
MAFVRQTRRPAGGAGPLRRAGHFVGLAAAWLAGGAAWGGRAPPQATSRPAKPWGQPSAGVQLSLTVRGPVRAGGKLVAELAVRNRGTAAVPTGQAEPFGWLVVQQRIDGRAVRHYSAKVHPARDANALPAELPAGRTVLLSAVDLSTGPAWPFDLRAKLLPRYLAGGTTDDLPQPEKTLCEVLQPGPARARFTLVLSGGRRPLALRSNAAAFDVAPADLAALPAAQRKRLTAELLARFDRDAWSAMAARRLAVQYGQAVVPALIQAVKQRRRPAFSRMWLAAALADIRDGRAAAALAELLADEHAGVRNVVAYHGAKQRSDRLDEAIVARAADRDDDRTTAYALLGFMVFRGRVPEPLLQAGIASNDPRARAQVAKALSHYASDFNVRRLIALLDDQDPRVRAAAATTLGLFGRRLPAVFEALVAALDAPDPAARKAVCDALCELSGEDMPYDPSAAPAARQKTVDAWKAWWARRKAGEK